ncbi:MAG: phosphoserine phosphatase SerB [Burkholderiales bacterium]
MNLVIQGIDVATGDLKRLAKMAGAVRIERCATGEAFRLLHAEAQDGVADYCAQAGLDFAFVPDTRRLTDFRLLVMDMDSTLINIECIDEIADMAGLKNEVATITAAAMRGEIADYIESLRRRVALLAGLDAGALERVHDERLALNPGAEKLIRETKHAGLHTLLVSGGFTFFTDRLKARLAIDETRSNELEMANGKLTGQLLGPIIDGSAKRAALLETRDRLGISRAQIVAIGDGANDLGFMAEAGISVAYHAKPVVRERTTHALDYVGLDGVLNLFN